MAARLLDWVHDFKDHLNHSLGGRHISPNLPKIAAPGDHGPNSVLQNIDICSIQLEAYIFKGRPCMDQWRDSNPDLRPGSQSPVNRLN